MIRVPPISTRTDTLFPYTTRCRSNTAEIQYYLGDIALKEGNQEAAKAAFQKGIQVDEKFQLNYVGLGRIDLLNKNALGAQDNFAKGEEQLRRKEKDNQIGRAHV